jgi:prevent-host-death family protein
MKVVNLREAKASLSSVVDESQKDRVLVTKHGKPAALIIGVAGEELEELILRCDAEFWAMIEARRASTRPRVSLEALEGKYTVKERKSASSSRVRRKRKKRR